MAFQKHVLLITFPSIIDEKIANATQIIEGKVISKTCFWNANHTFIFTANKIKVYKIFKGGMTDIYIEILTQGGTIGNETIEASDLLSLEDNEIGVFFLYPNSLNLKSPITNSVLMDVYSSSQGCFVYNYNNTKAVAPFVNYNSITGTLYTELQIKTGNNIIIKDASFNLNTNPFGTGVLATPSINSFSPTTVNAGASLNPSTNVLTIDGTNFGVSGGVAAVLFSDGNTGGISPTFEVLSTSNSIISWTNTQIKVKVPSRAATGYFAVKEGTGVVTQSSDFLNVFYSILASTLSGVSKEANLMNQNGTGGYTVYFSSSTDNSGVDLFASTTKVTVQRALATWREIVGMNWPEGGATTSQSIGNNTENLVMFDNLATGVPPLSAGVLAVCYSYFNGCSGQELQKLAFDIIIRNTGVSSGSANFTSGPCDPSSSQIDLETVLLHELGHALNLGHINDGIQGASPNNNPGKLMHYAVSNGVKRVTPDASAYQGALYVCAPQGNSYSTCLYTSEMIQTSYTVVTDDDCPTTFPTTSTNIGTVVPFDLAHATSNYLVDPQYTEIKCTGVGTGITNTQYYALKTLTSGILSLSISNYLTFPTEAKTCTNKGVELALYKVSTCPDGQNFPTPVACRAFSANGAIADITGLLANTNYLLFVDGVANIKTSFNMTFNGSALPIKLTSFTGFAASNYNQLKWNAEISIGTQKIQIEKSRNGIQFEKIGELSGDIILKPSNTFEDNNPYTGNNYYRLVLISTNGDKEYSKTILIKRIDKILFSINPNPVNQFANIQLSTELTGKYFINIYDVVGKNVFSNYYIQNSNVINTKINLAGLSNGIYQVIVSNEAHTKVASQRIVVEK